MYRAYYPMYFDPTYLLVIVGVLLCTLADASMQSNTPTITSRYVGSKYIG